jgi:predicted metalloprotease with PDZ domain
MANFNSYVSHYQRVSTSMGLIVLFMLDLILAESNGEKSVGACSAQFWRCSSECMQWKGLFLRTTWEYNSPNRHGDVTKQQMI